jgi:transposase
MLGRQEYQPELFTSIDMESLVPRNHLLRKVDRVLDLSFIRELAREFYCSDNGRPSIDPELYVRMLLIQYFYNIESDRQLCEEVGFNIAYRWFGKLSLQDKVPDHSSMTKIRDRLGEKTFKAVFEKIVKLCEEKGLVKGNKIMADGSLLKANASLESLMEKTEYEKILAEGKTPRKQNKNVVGQTFSNQTHISISDPDSKIAGKKHQAKALRYKLHSIIDRESRVILDPHITDGSVPEGTIFFDRLDHVVKSLKLKIEEATADRGYGYGEILAELEKRKIKSFIGNFHTDVGSHNYDPNLFKYDIENDRFICSKGYFLLPANVPSHLEQNQQIYRMLGNHCKNCPMNDKCYSKQHKVPRGKRLSMNIHHEIQARTRMQESTAEFKAALHERMWKIEGLFAEAKTYHGLDRARYRGRSKVQIQAYMIANVQNLKRLIGAIESILLNLRYLVEKLSRFFVGQKIQQKYPNFTKIAS